MRRRRAKVGVLRMRKYQEKVVYKENGITMQEGENDDHHERREREHK
jgi:hypothetical protein